MAERDPRAAVCELCFAAHDGEAKAVQALLSRSLNVNAVDYDRRSALHIAAADGHASVVEVLLAARAHVEPTDRWGRTAFQEAVQGGSVEVQQLLEAAGADNTCEAEEAAERQARKDIESAMSLCCAAAAGALPVVRELHQAGTSINAADYDGRTALHVASAHGHKEMVELLLSLQADAGKKDSFGLTPLADATRTGQGAVVDLLTREGAGSGADVGAAVQLSAFLESWAIPASEICLGAVLSTTLKSVLYRATWRGTEVVAKTSAELMMATTSIKQMETEPGTQSSREDMVNEMLHEIQLMSTVRHPDLVLFLGACFDHDTPFFISEFMEGGDLERYYSAQAQRSGFAFCPPGAKLIQWASAVARALAFLHGCTRPIIHRDLKPLNLLLSRSGELKVTDFGISKIMAPKVPGAATTEIVHDKPLMSGGVGTWRYMAPEVVRYEQYSDRIDIYSFALILWFMSTGRQPFVEQFGSDAELVLKDYLKGNEPRPDIRAVSVRLSTKASSLQDLITDCWHVTPSSRPSASECTQRLAAMCVRSDSRFLTSLLHPLSGLFSKRSAPA